MLMRKLALLSASALILALGVGSASAEPTTDQLMSAGRAGASSTSAPTYESRAASVEAQAVATDERIYQPRHAGR
jgi:hypothetical protein